MTFSCTPSSSRKIFSPNPATVVEVEVEVVEVVVVAEVVEVEVVVVVEENQVLHQSRWR